ncbi:hypothetical protein LINPERPRIM_LOCUS17130 [Linum perenne]
MAHGGYGKRRVAGRQPSVGRRSKPIDKKAKSKCVSLKNQIRSVERMLRKVLPSPLYFVSCVAGQGSLFVSVSYSL